MPFLVLRSVLGRQISGLLVLDPPRHRFPSPARFGLLGFVVGLSPRALDLRFELGNLSAGVYQLLLHAREQPVDVLRNLVAVELAVEVLDSLAECGTEFVEQA